MCALRRNSEGYAGSRRDAVIGRIRPGREPSCDFAGEDGLHGMSPRVDDRHRVSSPGDLGKSNEKDGFSELYTMLRGSIFAVHVFTRLPECVTMPEHRMPPFGLAERGILKLFGLLKTDILYRTAGNSRLIRIQDQ